jgi:uncharacterized protein YjdB
MKKMKKLSIFLIVLMVLNTFLSVLPQRSFAEEPPSLADDLILHYDMKTTKEDGEQIIVENVSGEGFDGIFKNPNNGKLVKNAEVGFVTFNGGGSTSKSGYIEIPKAADGSDLLSGLEDVTVSTLINWENDGANRWAFGLGTVSDDAQFGNKYFFVTPRHGSGNVAATGISKAGWSSESLYKGSAVMNARTWEVATVVFSAATDTITLYVNGKKVVSGSAKGIKLSEIIDPAAEYSGFIGKSIFKNDPFFKGSVGDFRVYGKALTDQEVGNVYNETTQKIQQINRLLIIDAQDSLNMSDYLGENNSSVDTITENLSLPTAGKNGVSITWNSSNPEVIANDGTVTRPAVDSKDVMVELTANLSYEGLTASKPFKVTVLKEYTDQQKVDLDAASVTIYNQDKVKGNIDLPVTGEEGSSISWESSHPEIIKGSVEAGDVVSKLGQVTRPNQDTNVTLTAKVTLGDASKTVTFDLTVIKKPEKKEYDAYFFSYFTGEYEGGEEISFATAEDPLKWRALNNGESVIQSTMGEKGLRDPFIIRSPEGDKFYMLATDLKMGESTNFDQAQITGSHSIMIWESDDLVNWSEQRMVVVAPKTGGNTWAPEAFYNEKTGEYVVFWASSMKDAETYGSYPNGRPSGQYNVMYYATTRDFYTFSEPKVFLDESFPTIDTSFVENEGTLYRLTKSEVNYKVYYEKANDIFYDKDGIVENGYQYDLIPGTKDGNRGLIGLNGNNEGQLVFKDIHEDKWWMFLDSWPYHVRWSTDLEDGSQFINNVLPSTEYALPPGPRHGTVIPITRAEYNALQEKYGKPGPEKSDEPVVHYTFDPEDIEGTMVKDVSSNGFDAKLVGGAVVDTKDAIGKSTGSVSLDGSTGYVELPKNLIKDLNLESLTLSTWVNVKGNQANQRIFDFSSDTGRIVNRNTMYLSTQGDSGNLEFAIVTPFTEKFGNQDSLLGSNYKYALRAPMIADKSWQHVAVTIEGYDAVVYVNGKEVARSSTYNVEPRMLLETTMNYLGKSSNDAHSLFNGKFDEFKIYNHALSAEEIAALADEEVPTPPAEEPKAAELILDYDMKNIEGTTVKDNTGKFNGTLVNPQNAQVLKGENVGSVSFQGGSVSSYIEMPKGVLDGLDSVTVSSLVNWDGNREAEWLFALGQDSNKYLFATPSRNSGDRSARVGLGITSWQNEAGANATTGKLEADKWKLVTAVMSGEEKKVTLYIDGVEVGSGPTNGYTLAQINNANGRSGYIARSFYTGDPYFGGMVADFEVYNGALSPEEILALKEKAAEKLDAMDGLILENASGQLDYGDFLNKNQNKEEIMTDLKFPEVGTNGTTITWASQNNEVITNNGMVKRPTFEEGNKQVVIIATISDGKNTVTKEFTVTVLSKLKDSVAVRKDAEALKVYNINEVRGNLTLLKHGEYGSVVTWKSADSSIITPSGEVTRPKHGNGDVTVKLTATIRLNNEVITKAFLANVKEMPQKEDYEGYVFSYFTGEGQSNGEQIYFALSEGNDPLHWKELNNAQPSITSEMGEKGLRDPFIIRSPEGDKFYLIATDLKIYGNGNWDRAQRAGSKSIMVWESTDLVNWSEQRMVEVSPESAGNTWAPEVMYDDTTGEYIVFWASKLYDNEEHSGSSHQRMMYAKTRDFHTFTEPQVYIDYGYSIIDTTMIEHDGKIYRFTKDERGNSTSTPNGKFIFQEVGDSVLDPNFTLIKEGIGKGVIGQGEGATVFKSNTEEKWYMFIDEFGGRGYVPFETTDLQSGEWKLSENYDLPGRPRHGTVLPVTKAEYDALLANAPAVKLPDTEQKVSGISIDKEKFDLVEGTSEQIKATVTPDQAINKGVVWSSSNEAVAVVDENGVVTAKKEGTALITAATVEGGFIAVSEVTVVDDSTPPVITITGNVETYSVDSMVAITCSVIDELSGIASVNCPNVEGPAYNYKIGVNTFNASAVDKAGNTVEVQFQFTVTVDFDSLSTLTKSFVTNEGIANGLTSKLRAAKESSAKDNEEAMADQLNAYQNQLKAQKGKSITEQNADILTSLVQHLR